MTSWLLALLASTQMPHELLTLVLLGLAPFSTAIYPCHLTKYLENYRFYDHLSYLTICLSSSALRMMHGRMMDKLIYQTVRGNEL